jgi:hypothetical protein
MLVGLLKAILFGLMPPFAIFKNQSINLKSMWYSPLIYINFLFVVQNWRSLCLLMKRWTAGNASLRWTRHPIFCLRSFAVVDCLSIIFLIEIVHALNLLSGSLMIKCLKSVNHPKKVFCSSKSASE